MILRLPVQHPAVGLQGECLESGVQDGSGLGAGMRYSDSKSSILQWSFRENAKVANNTQQDKITGEVVMI